MTVDDRATATSTGADHRAAANELVRSLIREPWGQVSPSVYETARLVVLAPWLTGHGRRIAYLLESQRPDGGWGGPGGYALVPTLSAADALIACLERAPDGPDRAALERAADRALGMLARLLARLAPADVPDMPAADVIMASLTGSIDDRLRGLRDSSSTVLRDWVRRGAPALPAWFDGGRLAAVLAALDAGVPLPVKLFHALEVAGPAGAGAAGAHPAPTGAIGAAPAATAAWLGDAGAADPGHPARRFLETVVRSQGGPVPCGVPVTMFERSWVLGTLVRAGLSPDVPAELVTELLAGLGPEGTPAAAGLPADADTTAMTLYSLSLLGVRCAPTSLLHYETDTHFCTWPGEDGHSASVNAHVLSAFGRYLKDIGTGSPDPGMSVQHSSGIVRKLSSWLCDQQHEEGSWHDRWHASPYYATVSCALALAEFGGDAGRDAVAGAIRWVLATQRSDGSWGAWNGTAEETAYALQTLLLTGTNADSAVARAVTDGRRWLLRSADDEPRPALWHDKDLYHPTAIVDAEILAALHLTRRGFAPKDRRL
ncbi:prenyltransferase/squalene oxidase repeat-containing protein [Spirillospora sp. NPDC052242]